MTTVTGARVGSSRTILRASSKLPRTCRTRAPCTSAWANLPSAMCPSGMSTAHVSPARAAYAAADAEVFPVDAQTTALAPSSTALEIAMVIPRSLKEPVGLAPSTFSQTSAARPLRQARRGQERRAAFQKGDDRAPLGRPARKSRYSSTTPRQPATTSAAVVVGSRAVLGTDDPQHATHAVHRRSRRRSSRVAATSPSPAVCVRKIRRASSPRPTCSIALIDTP